MKRFAVPMILLSSLMPAQTAAASCGVYSEPSVTKVKLCGSQPYFFAI